LFLLTSGTTAAPKIAMWSEPMLMRNIDAVATWQSISLHDRVWCPLPLFHMAALVPLLAALSRGATFVTTSHFSVLDAFDHLVAARPTILWPVFPAVIGDILDAATEPIAYGVRLIEAGTKPDDLERLERLFPGSRVINAFGSTEMGFVTMTPPEASTRTRTSTLGKPIPGMQIQLDAGRSSFDEPAEIRVRGPHVFAGYYGGPEAFDDDGWFSPGDVGLLDEDGNLVLTGRRSDMVKVGGENVAPAEIELVLEELPRVRRAQAVGVPDDRLGEVVAVFIERIPGATLRTDEVVAHCRTHLASFKVPRFVYFVDHWPMSATKIQKSVLRTWHSAARHHDGRKGGGRQDPLGASQRR
jgi:acyl-CoA synthetase (AMP-forming)/AMP-acid ligase II